MMLINAILLTCCIVLFYSHGNAAIGRCARALVLRLPSLWRDSSFEDQVALVSMTGSALAQFAMVGVVCAVTGIDIQVSGLNAQGLTLVLAGVLLGAADFAAAAYLGNVTMRTAAVTGLFGEAPTDTAWGAVSRGGWMRFYARVQRASARPLRLIPFAYIAGEELVFRAVLIALFAPWGAPVAITVSTLAFVVAQVFNTPSFWVAVFPASAAVVVGVAHAVLYLVVPDILPLIVAHGVMFGMAARR